MQLLPIRNPFATVWVAQYEPLIIEWLGRVGVRHLVDTLLRRENALTRAPMRRPPLLHEAVLRAAPSGTATTPRNGSTRPNPTEAIRRAFDRSDLMDTLADLKKAEVFVAADPGIRRELSPIGIVHFFRQLYFDSGAGVGPIEQVIAVAPREQLEVLERRVRRRTFERMETYGMEHTTESSMEDQVMDEVSETVQFSIANDINVGVSASAEGSIGVASAAASMTTDLSVSTQQAQELTRRRMTTQTRRSAEVVRRTQSVTISTREEVGEEYSMRRVIRNEGDAPVNYALRRVMRRVRIKLQSMGPRLVWQLYLCSPGRNLATSRLVMFPEAQSVAEPDLPPDAPPRPGGTDEVGTQTVTPHEGTIELAFPNYADRVLKSVVILDVVDVAPEGKDPTPPVLVDPATLEEADRTRAVAKVDPGSARRILVHFTAHFEPSLEALKQWEEQVADARKAFQAAQLDAQFEHAKRIIEARLRVRPRPAADLRDEERYEMLRRMIEEGFGAGSGKGPSPVEIELFHRYFDINALFYYVHPSWWRPRYSAGTESYEITEDSWPAPFGASLRWAIQLDGDRRRNEFLNSPWVRVCIPIRPGSERTACDWLAEHIEGRQGFSLEPTRPSGKLLADIEAQRQAESAAAPGPDYVTLDGEIAPGRESASETWPVIDEMEILQPTEGFVYEPITVGP